MYIGAAGNFLAPAAALSFNAFKTVMEIDAHGTFNVSKVVYDKYLKVFYIFFVKQLNFKQNLSYIGLVLWCLMPLITIFQLYCGVQFY